MQWIYVKGTSSSPSGYMPKSKHKCVKNGRTRRGRFYLADREPIFDLPDSSHPVIAAHVVTIAKPVKDYWHKNGNVLKHVIGNHVAEAYVIVPNPALELFAAIN